MVRSTGSMYNPRGSLENISTKRVELKNLGNKVMYDNWNNEMPKEDMINAINNGINQDVHDKAADAAGYAFDGMNFDQQGYKSHSYSQNDSQKETARDFVSKSTFSPDYSWL